jgi:hypothetical protein
MGATIEHDSSNLVIVRFTGRVKASEWQAAQKRALELFKTKNKPLSLLVIAEDFSGWESGGNWENTAFQGESDEAVARMAIVSEARWKDPILLFAGKGLRGFEIEHFPPSEIGPAQSWLAAKH